MSTEEGTVHIVPVQTPVEALLHAADNAKAWASNAGKMRSNHEVLAAKFQAEEEAKLAESESLRGAAAVLSELRADTGGGS